MKIIKQGFLKLGKIRRTFVLVVGAVVIGVIVGASLDT